MNSCVTPTSMASEDDTDVAERDPSGRYIRFNEILGKGACKTVYKAFDEVDGIEVAWNQVLIDDVVQSQEHLELLYSEIHLLKSLKHDNILKYYFSWVDDANRTINMITELFTSGSLRKYRKKHKKVDLKAIKNWARQVLRGLVYLHSNSPPIIHRDLKCDNIFINGNTGQVRIGDLGLAVVMHQPTVHSVIGTPEFMAPDIYEEEYNELVDIYSFGMCIMEMVTCEYPYYECENPCQIYRKVSLGIKPASLSKITDPELKEFIEKCILPASLRSSAAELLKDPFLNPDTSGKIQSVILPSSNNPPELQSHLMDLDSNWKKSCITESCECNYKSPPITIELSKHNAVNSFHLSGKEEGDDSLSMTLKIGDSFGHAKNIHFIYYLPNDTTLSIAGEMVDELNLPNKDAALIAELMDDLIKKIELRRSSNKSSAVEAAPQLYNKSVESYFLDVSAGPNSSCSGMSEDVNTSNMSLLTLDDDDEKIELRRSSNKSSTVEAAPQFHNKSEESCFSDVSAGPSSGMSEDVNTSNMSLLTLDDDDDKYEELEMELAAIDSGFLKLVAELEMMKAQAIEDAKRKWVGRKIPVH